MYRRGIKAWPEGPAKASFGFMEGLLLPRFLCFRPELRAPAFPAAGGPHGVPGVALHADHLVQPAMFGLGETGHRGGEARAVYNGFGRDRKSTRLNSSHVAISYAVFCLKKKHDR